MSIESEDADCSSALCSVKVLLLVVSFLAAGLISGHAQPNLRVPVDKDRLHVDLQQIADGLISIHIENIIPRDLKAGNVLFDQNRNMQEILSK